MILILDKNLQVLIFAKLNTYYKFQGKQSTFSKDFKALLVNKVQQRLLQTLCCGLVSEALNA